METSNSIAINSGIETSQQINEPEEEENTTPEYYNIYPPVDSVSENNYNLDIPFIKWDFTQQPKTFKETLMNPKNNDFYEMNEDFYESLLQRKSYYEKSKTINTICNFIRNSKLIKKLESETSDKKVDLEMLITNCAKSLGYLKLKKGEVLFKIGDIGDKFYFILDGKINVLKLKELKDVYMTSVEYLQYCLFLISIKEDYILNEVLKKNKKVINILYVDDIGKIYRIIFIRLLREKIINHNITSNEELLKFFSEYKQEISEFHITEQDLNNLQQQIQKGVFGSARDWENYILKRVRLTIKESIFFEEYEEQFKDTNFTYNIICYVYESFLFFGPGLFFGDFALDSENARRNATIRAEEKTYLGWMKSLDYANIIAPKRKVEKHNEIMFLYKNYFFKNINLFSFEKKYFHLFPPCEFVKGETMFHQSGSPKGLYFIKSGQIQIEIKVSLFELEFIIEQIFNKMIQNNFYKLVSKLKGPNYLVDLTILKNIKKNLKDPSLEKNKDKNQRLIEELNKKIKYKLTYITQNEIIGIEEIFLGVGYICSGEVISDKVICYELSEKQLNTFLEEEKSMVILYTKYSVNKIISLLDRLMNLRKSRIYISKTKYGNVRKQEKKINDKNDTNESEKNDEIIKKEDENNDNNENFEFKEKLNLIDIEKLANEKRKEFGSKYPLTKEAKINIKKILDDRNKEKVNIKKDKFLYSVIRSKKRKTEITNQKKIIKKKHFSFFKDLQEDKNNNLQKGSSKDLLKYVIPENSNKKDNNSLLVGNTCIEVDKIKKEIIEYNYYLNSKNSNKDSNYKLNNLSSDSHSQIFELSQLRYPLSDRVENNNNIFTNYNYNSMTIYKNIEGIKLKNEFKETEKNLFIKKITNSNSQKTFFEKIKNRNIGNSNNLAKTLTLSEKKIKIVNLSQEKLEHKNKKRIIRKKELLPGIIKEFDKKMRKQMLYSYINKRKTKKDSYENKKDKEYNFSNVNISNFLPKILRKNKID